MAQFLSVAASVTVLALASCAQERANLPAPGVSEPGAAAPMEIIQVLSADNMGGRQTGTAGNAKARAYLVEQLDLRDLDIVEQAFTFENRAGDTLSGLNIIARIKGKHAGPVMVVTAHYDHIGTRDGEVFNGADDNASGVAGAFAVADHFLSEQPEHDVVIALLDAEEMGLQGARALVRDGLPGEGEMAFNMNFDMLSKNDKNELYAAGAFHQPELTPLLDAVAAQAPVSLKLGHDDPALGSDDWTLQSDHGPFHQAGIPFVYFGVEDHKDYHQASDEFDSVPQDFFLRSLETVVMAAERFDAELGRIETEE